MTKKVSKIGIQEPRVLMPHENSKRLAALVKGKSTVEAEVNHLSMIERQPALNLSEHGLSVLKEAQDLIDQKIAWLSLSYPPGKQKKFFTLRYGSVESLKRKNIKHIFKTLEILAKPKNFNLITQLDYFGHQT